MITFLLGTARVDITPEWPVPLAGFAVRKALGPFDGVSHPLFAKIFVFAHQDEQGDRSFALLISADLLWWGSDRVGSLKQKIEVTWGVHQSSIVFHGTHTHSGPQTSERFTPSLGIPDVAYLEKMEAKVMQGISEAFERLEPVSIERGQDECRINIHRRKKVEGRVLLAPDEHGPLDPELHVIRFRSLDGADKAALIHYTCHPTITSANRISSEFCGVATEKLEQVLGSGVVVAYLQGCCGDVAPRATTEGRFFDGQDGLVCQLGEILADAAIQVLNAPMSSLTPQKISSQRLTVQLPLQKLPSTKELNGLMEQQDVYGEWSRLLLSSQERLQPTLPLEASIVHIAKGFSLLAMNAEVVVQYGLHIKQRAGGSVLPLAYSNGMIGYIPTAQQLADGGYEAVESTLYFGMASPLHPAVEALVYEAINKLFEDR